jgi:hypothetical protein
MRNFLDRLWRRLKTKPGFNWFRYHAEAEDGEEARRQARLNIENGIIDSDEMSDGDQKP